MGDKIRFESVIGPNHKNKEGFGAIAICETGSRYYVI
jgi:hypothetical protein